MAQLALLSHVAMLKQKDLEKESSDINKSYASNGSYSSPPPGQKGKRLNKTNEEAYFLISSGILG